jgi:fructose-1,6-bisphosphatase/inositol monophosphatase family enzyme
MTVSFKLTKPMLKELALKLVDIQSANERLWDEAESKPDNDIVTGTDKENERCIKNYLKELGIKYGFTFEFFGEEFGQDESIENNDYFISVDPIDGTRNFKDKVGYSAISVAFFKNGICEAGVINEINNQHEYGFGRYALYIALKGEGCEEAMYENDNWSWHAFEPKINNEPISRISGDMTFVKGFLKQWRSKDNIKQAISLLWCKLDLNTLRMTQNMSGCSSILGVLKGRIGFFINFCIDDILSHNAAILVAEECGLTVGHVYKKDNNFDIVDGKYKNGDGTVFISANESIKKSVDLIFNDICLPIPIDIS